MKKLPRMRFIYNRRGASAQKKSIIELEIYFSRDERKFINTGILIYPDQCSTSCMVKNHVEKDNFNKQLSEIKMQYERIIVSMQVDGVVVNLDNFNERIGKRKKQKKYISFIDFMNDQIKIRNIRETTRRTHYIALEALKRFGGIKSFESLTSKNIKLFDDFLRKENKNRSQTTIHDYHKRIKPYVVDAINYEYIKSNPYVVFSDVRGESKIREPLTKEEISLLRKTELPPKLDRVRDLFVFACYTGLAYSDMILFRYEKCVVISNGMPYIDGERLKTNTKFYTPLLKPAQEVLEKYAYKLPVISLEKYNEFLHLIEFRIGLRKNLTSHIARHTFATTITLANDIPIETVSRMLGHKDIRTTQIYAKILKSTIERHSVVLSNII